MPDDESDTLRYSVEDHLNNIQALQTFLLFVMENTDNDETLMLKGEVITCLYLLGEQTTAARHDIDRCARISRPPRSAAPPAPAG